MGSFVDKKRAAPPALPVHETILGFDPDLDVSGSAMIDVRSTEGTPLRIVRVGLWCDKYDQVSVAATRAAELLRQRLLSRRGCYVMIEGQQVYPDPDAPRQKIIAQANDLLHLALVAGAAHGAAVSEGHYSRVVLPSVWKKQRTKPADHLRSVRVLQKHGVQEVGMFSAEASDTRSAGALLTQSDRWEHALDALGIALYGFDLLSTNRWDP